MRHALLAIGLSCLLACGGAAPDALTFERTLNAGPSYTAHLISYRNDGLKLHAMIAMPRSEMPLAGYPVVVANHGYVPDPTKYGITAEGVDSRPGDYYRSVPELYASRGYLIVMPDYRGHNSSDGLEYVDGKESVGYYAEDVVALMSKLSDIEHADLENVFMWSHSMGGAVSMRALFATDVVKAASFWSTMPVDDLSSNLGELAIPIIIQHAVNDQTTAFANSERLAELLAGNGQSYTIHQYESSDHYFAGDMRELAADRDVAFFRSL